MPHETSSTLLGFRIAPAALFIFVSMLIGPADAVEQPAQVMFLGTYHFGNPGLDVVKVEISDVMTDKNQQAVQAIVDSLARFKPNKIALEAHPDRQAEFDQKYTAYRSGKAALTRNERQQIGFRLAGQSGHDKIYLIDQSGDYPFAEVMTYAESHNPAFVTETHKLISEITESINHSQQTMSVAELLRLENSDDRRALSHHLETRSVGIGAGDTFVGANLVSSWYRRNIMIFANLKAITSRGDRVIVVYGSGHATILRQFISSDPDMVLVEASDYLPISVP